MWHHETWYYDREGNVVCFTGSTFEQHDFEKDPRWHGPFLSEDVAVTLWERRFGDDVEVESV
jgi:hypothetical protein